MRTPRKLDPAEVGLDGGGFDVREARDTRYHRLLVVDDDDSRYLRFDSSFQSGMYLDNPFRTRFVYSDYLHLGLAYNPNAKKVLIVGLGGASTQKRIWRDLPDVQITTVELDPTSSRLRTSGSRFRATRGWTSRSTTAGASSSGRTSATT